MQKRHLTASAIMLLLAAGSEFQAKAAPAQPTGVTENQQAFLASDQFDELLSQQLDELSKRRQAGEDSSTLQVRLNQIASSVFDRLQKGFFVKDELLTRLVINSIDVERLKGKDYPESLRIIDATLSSLKYRPIVESRLYVIKGNLYSELQEKGKSLESYEKATSVMNAIHLDVDVERSSVLLQTANYAASIGEKAKANKLYLVVYSYPWYIAKGEAQGVLQEYSAQAGIGLINLRRGDLKALKDIYYVPSMKSRIEPALQLAIREAEKGKVFGSPESGRQP